MTFWKTVPVLLLSAVGCFATDEPPLGLAELAHPEDNPPTEAKIALGKKLFFDKRLSRDGTVSCATCHDPKKAFAQPGEATSKGIDGKLGRRNSPSLLNVAFAQHLFHDGRAKSLEEQAWQPILADDEMGNRSEKEVLERLAALGDYGPLFKKAFDVERPDKASVAKALAVFQRTLLSGNSRFDKWYWGGESELLTKQEIEGFDLFAGQALCWQCHPFGGEGLVLTDHQFHNTGVAWVSEQKSQKKEGELDMGRFEVTKREQDRRRYKTPSLRNVAITAPYMHDGSFKTLKEVVKFYNKGGGNGRAHPLYLNEKEIDAVVAFLETLTGDHDYE